MVTHERIMREFRGVTSDIPNMSRPSILYTTHELSPFPESLHLSDVLAMIGILTTNGVLAMMTSMLFSNRCCPSTRA